MLTGKLSCDDERSSKCLILRLAEHARSFVKKKATAASLRHVQPIARTTDEDDAVRAINKAMNAGKYLP